MMASKEQLIRSCLNPSHSFISGSFSSLMFIIGKVLNPVCFIFKTKEWKLKSVCARGAGDIKADVPGASVLLNFQKYY